MLKKSLCCALIAAAPLFAHAAGTEFNYAVTPVYVPDFNLDSGGKASTTWILGSVGAKTQIDPQQSLGVTLKAARQDWSFENPQAWGGVTPWGNLNRVDISLPYTYATQSGWLFSVAPNVQYAGETGADQGESMSYGATAFAAKFISPGLMLGLGLGAWTGLEESQIFPFLIVNWQITDALRLGNPFVASPAGPAGLELAWKVAPQMELAAGGTWRSYQTRLATDNKVAANGVLEDNSIPLFVRGSYTVNKAVRFDAYVGSAVSGEFIIYNQNGQKISTEKHDAMPFVSLSMSGTF